MTLNRISSIENAWLDAYTVLMRIALKCPLANHTHKIPQRCFLPNCESYLLIGSQSVVFSSLLQRAIFDRVTAVIQQMFTRQLKRAACHSVAGRAKLGLTAAAEFTASRLQK